VLVPMPQFLQIDLEKMTLLVRQLNVEACGHVS
jgi:hypothetical protein